MSRAIDLNADLGEGYGPWRMGDDAALLSIVTSANVACGGHAGDPETMHETLLAARARGVAVGAHPGYPDRQGFGRRRLPYGPAECERFLAAQIGALDGIAALAGVRVSHVKVHGALALLACDERPIAEAVARAVAATGPERTLLAISGTVLEEVGRERGLRVASEVFADRGYGRDGRLLPRDRPGAFVHDAAAAARMVGFLRTGLMPTADGGTVALRAESICVHGDGPEAVATARTLREALAAEGIVLRPFAGDA